LATRPKWQLASLAPLAPLGLTIERGAFILFNFDRNKSFVAPQFKVEAEKFEEYLW
jgi:hypothetical protein